MYGSLSWIEWLDRLDRVLTSARQDVLALSRAVSPRSMAAVERSIRQLTALSNDLRLLDRNVLSASADHLQTALETAVFRLGTLSEMRRAADAPVRESLLSSIDTALRDSLYEAAMLLQPSRRRA